MFVVSGNLHLFLIFEKKNEEKGHVCLRRKNSNKSAKQSRCYGVKQVNVKNLDGYFFEKLRDQVYQLMVRNGIFGWFTDFSLFDKIRKKKAVWTLI